MNRRQFLLSLALALSGFKAHAASFDPEDIHSLRLGNHFDAAKIEKKYSKLWLDTLNQGQRIGNGTGKKIMNESAQRALTTIAQPLWRVSTRTNLNWNIILTDSSDVNACTPGGGLILIYKGLISQCAEEVELASVIAHEIGHVQHRHAIQRIMTQVVQQQMGISPSGLSDKDKNGASMEMLMEKAVDLINLSYGRLHEHQADAFIIQAFLKAGYPPSKASLFFHRLIKLFDRQSPNYCLYSTHPLMVERIKRMDAIAASYGSKNKSHVSSEAFRFLKTIS